MTLKKVNSSKVSEVKMNPQQPYAQLSKEKKLRPPPPQFLEQLFVKSISINEQKE